MLHLSPLAIMDKQTRVSGTENGSESKTNIHFFGFLSFPALAFQGDMPASDVLPPPNCSWRREIQPVLIGILRLADVSLPSFPCERAGGPIL
jgi:hypothetical protein